MCSIARSFIELFRETRWHRPLARVAATLAFDVELGNRGWLNVHMQTCVGVTLVGESNDVVAIAAIPKDAPLLVDIPHIRRFE